MEKLKVPFRKFDYRKLWALMPVLFVSYVVWVNLAPSGSVEEFLIDVGADDTVGNARLTGPFERVSDPATMGEVTYRNLTSNLVYFVFEYPFSDRASEIEVSIRFKDTLLENEGFFVGAENGKGWSYDWNIVYAKFLQNRTILRELPTNVPEGSLVATDMDIGSKRNVLDDVDDGALVIDSFLRGSHTAYVYVKHELNLTVSKRDLNWYVGQDTLRISVFRGKDLVNSIVISDDGTHNVSRQLGRTQTANTYLPDLEEGVYSIVFENNADLFINRIEVHPAEFVLDGRAYSIGTNSSIYYGSASETKMHFSVDKKRTLRFMTSHVNAFQNVTVNSDSIEIGRADTWFEMEAEKGFYELVMPKSDVIVEGNIYLSFTVDSYFDPFEHKTVNIDHRTIKEADYIVSNVEFKRDGEWTIAKTTWNVDDLFIEDEEISFVMNVPFLANSEPLPIDWIGVKVVKNPLV